MEKTFIGKEDVVKNHSKTTNTQKPKAQVLQHSAPKAQTIKTVTKTSTHSSVAIKQPIKTISPSKSSNDDEWESF
jgi:hypothetical protein